MTTGPHPPMAATAVTFPGVPVPSMTQIAVHPYHTAEAALPLSTTVAGKNDKLDFNFILTWRQLFGHIIKCYLDEGWINAGFLTFTALYQKLKVLSTDVLEMIYTCMIVKSGLLNSCFILCKGGSSQWLPCWDQMTNSKLISSQKAPCFR